MCLFWLRIIIFATNRINKGLTNSIGWNLGKKGKSSHLFEPLTSTPNIGTKQSNKTEIINKKGSNLINLFFSWIEIKTIKKRERRTNIKCLRKKK